LLSTSLNAILASSSPQSVILYGSLGRGEASVIISGEQVQMVSDCEIRVIDPSPKMRRICAKLTRQLTSQLGCDISIAWMHPNRLKAKPSLPGNSRKEPPSIFWYEFVSAGKTIFGQDLINNSPAVNPDEIPLASGIMLILNRMAESLSHLPCSDQSQKFSRLENIIWINKTILAAADALLLSQKKYHFSYKERQNRFDTQVVPNLPEIFQQVPVMPEFVRRATQFKLHPDLDLYPADLTETWEVTALIADSVLKYLVKLEYGKGMDSYADFPGLYLGKNHRRQKQNNNDLVDFILFIVQKMVEALKFLEQKSGLPAVNFTSYRSSQVVYALVPVIFFSCFSIEKAHSIGIARTWLSMLGKLEPAVENAQAEWNYLSRRLTDCWKIFCY
jgi:hypothetical protein